DLGATWTERFGDARQHSLTAGAQLGITNVSINYNALRFDAQYNGFSYDPSLGNAEQFTRDARSRMDVHAGAAYRYAPDARHRFTGGLALFKDRKSTRLNSSHVKISYAVSCSI